MEILRGASISKITDKVIEEMQAFENRPLRCGVRGRDHGQGPGWAGRQPVVALLGFRS